MARICAAQPRGAHASKGRGVERAAFDILAARILLLPEASNFPRKPTQMKIATFNINGIRSRLPGLLEWLAKEAPDVVCLQELKAPDSGFPVREINAAGYGAIWHGQTSWNGVAILQKGGDPLESRRGLPGDKEDKQSRYIEAAIDGMVIACLYLPNGNPQPGPKFQYKLAWFERLIKYSAALLASEHPAILAGDFNVVPTDNDIYNPRSWLKDALLQLESRMFRASVKRGLDRCASTHIWR